MPKDIEAKLKIPEGSVKYHLAKLCGLGVLRRDQRGYILIWYPDKETLKQNVNVIKSLESDLKLEASMIHVPVLIPPPPPPPLAPPLPPIPLGAMTIKLDNKQLRNRRKRSKSSFRMIARRTST